MSLWTNIFGPKTPQELLINKNKILEVKNLLDDLFIRSDSGHNSRKPILVIFGPNGIGKTTVLRCLCNNRIKIIEWEPPTTLNEGLGASFYRFIFNSVFFSKTSLNEKVLVLIKDLPITLLQHNSQVLIEIRHFLSKIVLDSSITIPIVFITGEDRNERQFLKLLLPGELDIFNENCTDKKFARYIKIVRLNPVPSTVIKSKLKFILNARNILIGRFEENAIEKIVQTSNGDLCHAISQLQFFFEGGHKISNGSSIHCPSFNQELFFSGKRRKNSSNNFDLSAQGSSITFGKEPMYNLFRTIGKILYNKREECNKQSKLEYLHNTYSKRIKINSDFSDIYDSKLKSLEEIDLEQKPDIYYYCEGFKDIFDSFFNMQASQDSLKGRLSFDVEDLLIYSGVEDNSLILLLQENYIPFIGNSNDTIMCSNIFSWSDIHTNYLDSDYFSSILASCIARTILYFNSKPLNPCSPDYQVQDDLKVGFSKNQFSLWKKRGNFQNKTLESNNLIEKPKKAIFKWHPKKPAFKTFVSSLEALKEDCKNLINKCLPFYNETNSRYLLFSKAIFTEIFPYLNYLLSSTNNDLIFNNTINGELTKFLNNWSKYNKYIPLCQLNFKGSTSVALESDQILYCHDNSSNAYCYEYLSDEQLVSILETCDVENFQSNPVVNNFFESKDPSNNDIPNSICSSDDSVDCHSE